MKDILKNISFDTALVWVFVITMIVLLACLPFAIGKNREARQEYYETNIGKCDQMCKPNAFIFNIEALECSCKTQEGYR